MREEVVDTGTLYSVVGRFNKKVIIFDIFDTIIHRNIHPEDIKKIFANRLVSRFDLDMTYEAVYALRAQAEIELCAHSRDRGFDLEFRFNDMCDWIYAKLGNRLTDRYTLQRFTEECRELELSAEFTNQYVDENVVSLIHRLKKEGFTVLCCSDFYLDYELISRVLDTYGLGGVFDEIFVSSEYLVTKRSGRLYEVIVQKYDPAQCLMVGDNLESDCNQSGRFGISSVYLNREHFHTFYSKLRDGFTFDGFKSNVAHILSRREDALFPEYALTSFYFIHKLYYKLRSKGYKDAFFLAREGQVLKEMFDLYQSICVQNKDLHITSHYLMASRRSTFMPSLKRLEQETFFNLFRQYIHISFAEFLYSLGFSDEQIIPLGHQLGIDIHKKERDFPKSEAFVKVMISDDFYHLYETRRVSQKSNLTTYLDSFNRQESQRIALVDVGWKGTIQDNIYKALEESVAIEGFYIGLVVPADGQAVNNLKHGLLFNTDQSARLSKVFDENRSLFEVLYAANHGSVISFDKNQSGAIDVQQEDFNQEVDFYKNCISPIINEVLIGFRKVCAEFKRTAINEVDLLTLVAKNHSRMVFTPSLKELDWHLGLYHVENFGVFERNIFNRKSKSISAIKKLSNYYKYKNNPERVTQGVMWPAAEFKKRGLDRSLKAYSKSRLNNIFN